MHNEASHSLRPLRKCTTPSSSFSQEITTCASGLVTAHVIVKIGSNTIPLFALVDGGRGRSLHTFRCVYTGCAAFMDIRVLPHADVIKWVVMGVSHNHHFGSFPRRLPRNTLGADVRAAVHAMVLRNRPCAEIRRQHGILCNKNVLQNAMRSARKELVSEQSRSLRDAAASSQLWSTEIHLCEDNVFHEAFFVNAVLVSRRLDVVHVFMDDTSCTNHFSFPSFL